MEERLVYTDGTIIDDIPGWVFAVFQGNEVVYETGGLILDKEFAKLRNIASELKAVVEAVRWAKQNECKLLIYTDLRGNIEWRTGTWKCNNKYTKFYKKFMEENKEYIKDVIWIKGHGIDDKNIYVDNLSRKIYHREIEKLKKE